MVFVNDHFRLMADDSYRINRRLLVKRIDLAIACSARSPPGLAGH